jgi:cyclophilin family peptidyl-prolyl cis-trans isomerase/HEAT repeat protein
VVVAATIAAPSAQTGRSQVPRATLLRIVEAEDQRRWDGTTLGTLLDDPQESVRRRAALAAGRIGNPAAVRALTTRLGSDPSAEVRAMAAFALGEIEAETALPPLLAALRSSTSAQVRARALEALGKIGAAPATTAAAKTTAGNAIATALADEQRRPAPTRQLVLLGLTAAFRARADGSPAAAAQYLAAPDARVRADALNALARMRSTEALPRVRMLLATDPDAMVRANAARVLGAAADVDAYDPLVAVLGTDPDPRPRVGAVRALMALNDRKAVRPLIERGQTLLVAIRNVRGPELRVPVETNELLEIATALGRLLTATDDAEAIRFLRVARMELPPAPEIDIALARIGPAAYANPLLLRNSNGAAWQALSAIAQALGEIGGLTNLPPLVRSTAEMRVRAMLGARDTPLLAVSDLLRALQAYTPGDLERVVKPYLDAPDTTVRETAAEILGLQPAATQAPATDRRAIYERAIARIGRRVQAVLTTDKGVVTLDLLPEDAPLTVDNFVSLALLDYFDGLAFHRVVSNFVVQGGDPRGDGTGGPGYSMRCEINLAAHETGTVAMALSGKDTGGSQFYVTHSPQPHLDGGYTVFGRVTEGQDVVDRLARGDRIMNVTIVETP